MAPEQLMIMRVQRPVVIVEWIKVVLVKPHVVLVQQDVLPAQQKAVLVQQMMVPVWQYIQRIAPVLQS